MPQYHYKAADSRGTVRYGWLEAENERNLELRLAHMDLLLISHSLNDERSLSVLRSLFGKKIGWKTLILFCIHMEQMLAAGHSVPDALEGVRDSIDSVQFRDVITSILVDINNGKNFSDALESYSTIIPPAIASLVRVGERTGNMVEIFQGLGANLKWEDELEAQAKHALRYPAFTGMIILAVALFMMAFVVPQLMSFLSQIGENIPLMTRALIAFSDFLINWWWGLLVAPFIVWFTVRLLCRFSSRIHLKVDRFKLHIWFFGPLMYKLFLIRFTANFALMYRSGIPVLEAIKLNGGLSRNREVINRIDRVMVQVTNGFSISSAFKETEVFPPPLPKLLEAGEEGGQLSTALLNVSYFLDREVREDVAKVQSMIEPILTLTMGVLLVWIILSVFAPIYQAVGTMAY
jgi:type IV pilus assembly protein PilC